MTSDLSAFSIALVGLLSAIVGGALQASFARNFERIRFERQAKWDLYTQFFLVIGEMAVAANDPPRLRNARSLMAQIRGRIGIVGSAEVVRAVGQVFTFSHLTSDDAQAAMVSALQAMRRDVGKRDTIARADFEQLVFSNGEGTN